MANTWTNEVIWGNFLAHVVFGGCRGMSLTFCSLWGGVLGRNTFITLRLQWLQKLSQAFFCFFVLFCFLS